MTAKDQTQDSQWRGIKTDEQELQNKKGRAGKGNGEWKDNDTYR